MLTPSKSSSGSLVVDVVEIGADGAIDEYTCREKDGVRLRGDSDDNVPP